MKVFWAMILVLALAAGGLLFMRGRDRGAGAAEEARALTRSGDRGMEPPAPPGNPSATERLPGGGEESGGAASGPAATEGAVSAQGVGAAQAQPDVDAHPPEEGTEPGRLSRIEGDAEAGHAAEAPPAGEETEGAQEADGELPGGAGAENTVDEAPDAASGAAPGEAASAPVVDVAPAPAAEEAAPEEPEARAADAESEPGVLLLNGRHRVTGEGTAAAPYVVSWDTLVALEGDYEPKTEGKKQVPEWIKALDGKHVSITGFIAFPFIAPTADECMVMLNQWDGCCIGVPPTPYDAVEVKLAETLDLQQGMVNYGTITGVFRTDPYLVNGWLIGLYVMDDAKLTSAGGKNTGGF